jgi:hypothetical protein
MAMRAACLVGSKEVAPQIAGTINAVWASVASPD